MMSKRKILNRMLGVATLAMMFGTASVYAQSATPDTSGAGSSSKSPMSGSSSSGAADTSGSSGSSSMGSSSQTPSSSSGMSGTTPSTSGASGTTGAAASTLSQADQTMVKDLAQANMAEVEAAKLAQQKSSNDQVKTYAQKMIDDHTKANDQLQQLAQSKNVTLPTALDSTHRSELKNLSALSGTSFDKKYMSQGGVTDHGKTHALLTRIQKNAKDTDLKTLASNMLPTVDEHWQMAKQMSTGKGSSATGTSGTTGTSKGSGASPDSGTSGGSMSQPGSTSPSPSSTTPGTSGSSGTSSSSGASGSSK